MSNSTHLPVRRVRTAAVYEQTAPVDAGNEQEYAAYDGYETYDGYDAYEGYEEQAQPQRGGLFGSPARALALGGSLVALLLVFSAAILIMAGRGSTPATVAPTSGVTDVAVITSLSDTGVPSRGQVPPNFEWTDPVTKQTVSLTGLKGKPVWINFWGTWCPPCREEMPAMQKMYQKYKDDLVILGVSMGPRDDPGMVSEFLKQYNYGWTFIHDSDMQVAAKYQAVSIPMSYFIGPDGVVKAVSVGAIPENMMESMLAQAKGQ